MATVEPFDALEALDHIMRTKPVLVAMQDEFSATSRGTALINRIKDDPTLTNCFIVDVGSSVEVLPLEWLSRLDAVAYAHSANHARFAFIPDQNAVDSPDANFVELDNGYGRPRVDHIRPHR